MRSISSSVAAGYHVRAISTSGIRRAGRVDMLEQPMDGVAELGREQAAVAAAGRRGGRRSRMPATRSAKKRYEQRSKSAIAL